MEDEERLMAQLAMFVSGSKGWVAEAEEQDIDGDAIEEVKQAHEHVCEHSGFWMNREKENLAYRTV